MIPDSTLLSLFASVRTIAVVGAKDAPGQPVDRVGRYLLEAGYTVIPVHPVRKGVWGLSTYTALGGIPHPIDMVVVFRAPQYCLAHATEALAMVPRPQAFWMQQGIECGPARTVLENAGGIVIEDACVMVEHARLYKRPVLQGACPLRPLLTKGTLHE